MKLTANQIRYLLVIRKLNETKHVIKSVDIASQLDYSRASIHKMLKFLKKESYVKQEPYGDVSITRKGLKLADDYNKNYNLIKNKLKSIVDIEGDYDLAVCCVLEKM